MCAQNIEIMPGIVVDLNEGLERGDLIDGKTQIESQDAADQERKEAAAAETILNPPEAKVEGAEGTDQPKQADKKEEAPTKEEVEALKVFKIKYAGEEKELKLTDEQIILNLQKAYDYDKKIAKLAEDRREVEPFKKILDTPWFKTKLEEGLASGEIEKPAEAPPPPEEAVFELERRKMDPDFENVREAMRNWAMTLPVTMQHQLDSNVVVFNREYDRVAAKLREPKTRPPLNLTPAQTKTVDKVIQAKERAKEAGRIEAPGSTSELNPDRARQTKVRDLKKAMKQGGRGSDAAAAEFLLMTAFAKNKE